MDKELEQIIRKLIDKTNKGEVRWNKSDSPNEYRLSLDDGRISAHLFSVKNPLGIGTITRVECVVENLRGDVVLRGVANVDTEESALLYALYDAAFRSYTGRDAVIKGIMGQLNGDGVIGEEDLQF